jgi:hypothetical protein
MSKFLYLFKHPASGGAGCVKLMGEWVMAEDFDRQVAELQVRVVIFNRLTQHCKH